MLSPVVDADQNLSQIRQHSNLNMTRGLLYVESDPGSQCTLEEYHDWYNGEHVPLRMDGGLPEFINGARWEAADDKTPRFTATYEVTDTDFFQNERYTRLRANRSAREAEVVRRLDPLDRRTCSLISDTGSPPPLAAPFIISSFVTPANEEEYNKWYEEEHIDMLKKVPGWRRTHRYKVYDALKTSINHEPKANVAPTICNISEYDGEVTMKMPELKAAISTDWAGKVHKDAKAIEVRFWKLYKTWPNTARSQS